MTLQEEKHLKTELIKTRVFFYLSGLILLLAFLTIGLISYWLVFPYDVLDVKKLPVPVTRTPTSADGIIVLKFNYCKNMEIEGNLEISMISTSTAILLPPAEERTHAGCRKDFNAPVIIPSQASNGTYFFHYKVTYKVNPLKTIVEEFDTEKFEVINQ